MQRFLLFTGTRYYPSPGARDLKATFDTQDEAVAFARTNPYDDWNEAVDGRYDWWQVFDVLTLKIVAEKEGDEETFDPEDLEIWNFDQPVNATPSK